MITRTVNAFLLTDHGGIDKLDYRADVPTPQPAQGEALIRVTAAGVHNTDINTRIGWYSKAVTADTETGWAEGFGTVDDDDASWSGVRLSFPRIQQADVCGHIVAVCEGVDPAHCGQELSAVRHRTGRFPGQETHWPASADPAAGVIDEDQEN